MTEETFNILSLAKQPKALEEQPGLEENVITEILKKRDAKKAYKIALEASILFYHLTDRNDFPDEEASLFWTPVPSPSNSSKNTN